MKTTSKKKIGIPPSATSLSTPIYHRRRRDWRDDQYLIEEILKHLEEGNGSNQNSPKIIAAFKKIVSEIASAGFQSNDRAFTLAMWIREQLTELAVRHGGYDLRVHFLKISPNFGEVISERYDKFVNFEPQSGSIVSLETLFPDPEIRSHVLERVQLLHKGNLLSYLSSLVKGERESLSGESATIMDLIHICEEKLKQRKLKTVSNFNANEVDLWVPGLSLGIEIRDALCNSDREDLIRVLMNTNSSKNTKFLVVICPDDLSDLLFYNWREIERSGIVPNLSVLRVGDLGKYLDKISLN